MVTVAGKVISDEVLDQLRVAVAETPAPSRRQLSLRLCQWLGWKNAQGRWQTMTARTALLALARRGVLTLPVVKPLFAKGPPKLVAFVPPVLNCPLAELGPIELVPVTSGQRNLSQLWNTLVSRFHPLGYQPMAGAQLRYLIRCRHGWLGALGFGASAKSLQERDQLIGWSPAERRQHGARIVCNWRFLLLPTVQVKHLASHVLGRCARQLPEDWQVRYGYRPVLLETFVGAGQAGTCYQAANWINAGQTAGRGRNDRRHAKARGAKTIWLYPLAADWRRQLAPGAAFPAPLTPAWVAQEFATARLPDVRLQRRLETIGQDFYRRPEANLPEACGTMAKTKAAYRFFAHPKVQAQDILAAHRAATLQRLTGQPVILAVQDSTGASYGARPGTSGLGPIDTDADSARGLWVHTTMAYTPAGLALGILEMQAWSRPPAAQRRAKGHRNQVPIEQKESYKWLQSFQATQTCQAQLPGTRLVSVADREADVYELFREATAPENQVALLVRVQHKQRKLSGEDQKLRAHVTGQSVQGIMAVAVPRRIGQPARQAQLELRFCRVEIQRPRDHDHPIVVWAIQAYEAVAPAQGPRIDWLLLTTLSVTTVAEAVEKVQWYSQRFKIEGFHRILKSGCRMEKRQLLCAEALRQCLALDLIVAWRIAYLSKFGREQPTLPCSVAFAPDEWQALYCLNHKTTHPPATPPALQPMIRDVAKLGGFLGRKRDGEPGAQTLWRGLQRLTDITDTWRAVLDLYKITPTPMGSGP